ncbi:hypothetical protein M2271_005785 [Streptomyces sp. LBL]|uniref:hypothetical protein n=1 Tax=Streptomyces sp. LBL TaxID=2940562 RepID=UPI002475A7E4|nr:hypothetical protein [Streptomyces sp. LBL]MDH6627956.1 hypothetical protein [Streptomyces sp. LBL]
MPTNHTASPPSGTQMEGRAYVLLLDDDDRILLCGSCCGGWTVPQFPVDPDVDFRAATTQFLSAGFRIDNPRYGRVYGIHTTGEKDCWERDRPTVSQVFIVRIDAQESMAFLAMSPSHVRWGARELVQHRRMISPEGVILLARGYVEGWLPDGSISLY